MSQNVMCWEQEPDALFVNRRPLIKKAVLESSSDVIGFQEVKPDWTQWLSEDLVGFENYTVYRDKNRPEGTPIYWKADKLDVMDKGHFWLSETPMAVSKGWNSDHFRVASRAGLRHKESGKILQLFNTHFDWVAPGPRESAQLIIRKAEKLGDVPVFAIADFNFTPDSPPWHSMRSWFYDVREEIAPENTQSTTCSYRPAGSPGGHIIDYCFYHGNGVKPTRYEVLTKEYDGKFVSDHFGVYFEFEVEE